MMLEKVAAEDLGPRHGGEGEIDVFNDSFERRTLQFDREHATGLEMSTDRMTETSNFPLNTGINTDTLGRHAPWGTP
jgi:hypothetical protein